MNISSNTSLAGRVFGRIIRAFDVVDSTNDEAMRLAEEGAEEGTVVLADEQRKGKGRLGRFWVSPRGGIWMSIVLRPRLVSSEAPFITMIAGVAIATSIREQLAVDAGLKWPNDVLIGGKKVSGVLSEIAVSDGKYFVILGVGVNVNFYVSDLPAELRSSTTTLLEELKNPIDLSILTVSILRNFESRYTKWQNSLGEKTNLLNEWRELSTTLGTSVKVMLKEDVIEGVAEDVAEDGALIIRLWDGAIKRILAGDIFYWQ